MYSQLQMYQRVQEGTREVKQDELCGIERYPKPELFGELVCPDIHIWAKPFGMMSANNKVIATLKHGQAVEVIGERTKADYTSPVWVKVRWIETHESENDQPAQKVMHGWLSKRFLLKGDAYNG